jgi:hypothetical protein
MNQPKIELRAIQTSAFASEETHCYTATLYVDGLKWGSVSNEGHGGADHFHGVDGKSYADLKALDAQIAATYPESDVSYLYGEETPAGTPSAARLSTPTSWRRSSSGPWAAR